MTTPEEETSAFILRFWREARTLEDVDPIWRSVLEEVPTGRRYYMKDLDELVMFVFSHLREKGVTFNWCWRLWARWQAIRLGGQEQEMTEG